MSQAQGTMMLAEATAFLLSARVEAGSVHGMGDGEIVGMDDKKFRVGRIAQALGDCLILRPHTTCCQKKEQVNGGAHSNLHKQLQRARLAVKRNTTAEAKSLLSSQAHGGTLTRVFAEMGI